MEVLASAVFVTKGNHYVKKLCLVIKKVISQNGKLLTNTGRVTIHPKQE